MFESIETFTGTGSITGNVWGTDIYSDGSNLATTAVHAGVVQNLQIKYTKITILPGQSSYTASTRNNVTAKAWSSWLGSYSFNYCN